MALMQMAFKKITPQRLFKLKKRWTNALCPVILLVLVLSRFGMCKQHAKE
jgi:hypothetical protein